MNGVYLILGATALFLFSRTAAAGSVVVNKDSEGYRKYGETWGKYDSLFQDNGAYYGVEWKDLKAIAIIESDLGLNSLVASGGVSSDGKSWGLMQFTMPTAKDYDPEATVDKLNDPAYSIDLAAQYLRHLAQVFPGDKRKQIMSYNQGEGNTKKGKEYSAGYYTKWVQARNLVEKG